MLQRNVYLLGARIISTGPKVCTSALYPGMLLSLARYEADGVSQAGQKNGCGKSKELKIMHSDTDTQASEIEEIKNTQRLAKLDECFERYGAYDEISWPDYAKKLQQDQEEFEARYR